MCSFSSWIFFNNVICFIFREDSKLEVFLFPPLIDPLLLLLFCSNVKILSISWCSLLLSGIVYSNYFLSWFKLYPSIFFYEGSVSFLAEDYLDWFFLIIDVSDFDRDELVRESREDRSALFASGGMIDYFDLIKL